MKKILLLGSGELGKEFVISAQQGWYIIACDSYAERLPYKWQIIVIIQPDGDALERVVRKHQPDIIVPEIGLSVQNVCMISKKALVVPSARAVNFTMNRKAIQ